MNEKLIVDNELISHSGAGFNSENTFDHSDNIHEFFSPASRAYFSWQEGLLSIEQFYQHQAGNLLSGENIEFLSAENVDIKISLLDGRIASANHENAFFLDEPGLHWTKHNVVSGESLTVTWNNKNEQLTNQWSYFITREDWNPERPLSREQFEETPLYITSLSTTGEENHGNQLSIHEIPLPERRGYHVLLAVMEENKREHMYFQIVDLFFFLSAQQPPAPYGLRVTAVSKNSVALAWSYPVSPLVFKYDIYRNDKRISTEGGSSQFFTDQNVKTNTEYTYAIQALTVNGEYSPLSEPVTIRTLGGSSQVAPPEPPVNLQYSGVTNTSVRLNWQHAGLESEISNYVIYRNSIAVGNVTYPTLTFLDTRLNPDTQYYYYVVAVSIYNLSSLPSMTIFLKTRPENEVYYPDWREERFYPVGAKVYSLGNNWRCLKAHISFCVSGQPGKLWEKI